MLSRYVVEAPVELLFETPQISCGDLARQRMIDAEDARRLVVETSVYCDGLNQVAAVILAAKKVILVGGLRELELEADCSGVVCKGRACLGEAALRPFFPQGSRQ